jgi:hypothetical protein
MELFRAATKDPRDPTISRAFLPRTPLLDRQVLSTGIDAKPFAGRNRILSGRGASNPATADRGKAPAGRRTEARGP